MSYQELLEKYQDIQSDIYYEKQRPCNEQSELFRLEEESNDLYQVLNTKYNEEFNKKSKQNIMTTFSYTFILKDSNSNVLQTRLYDCINENDAKELSNILYGDSSQYLGNCESVIYFRTQL